MLIAWPHAGTDWAERLAKSKKPTSRSWRRSAVMNRRDLRCDEDVQAYARARLASARVDMGRVRFVDVPYDDTWLRDSGPIALRGRRRLSTAGLPFTGWAGSSRQVWTTI